MLIVRLRNAIRFIMLWCRHKYLICVYHMDIASTARISWGVALDRTYPCGIHIGCDSYVASGTVILAHDFCRGLHLDTRIGKRCFIGCCAVILPGVNIGDSVVVGAGSVVTRDVPSGCIVAGNPARVIREGIQTGEYGRIVDSVK